MFQRGVPQGYTQKKHTPPDRTMSHPASGEGYRHWVTAAGWIPRSARLSWAPRPILWAVASPAGFKRRFNLRYFPCRGMVCDPQGRWPDGTGRGVAFCIPPLHGTQHPHHGGRRASLIHRGSRSDFCKKNKAGPITRSPHQRPCRTPGLLGKRGSSCGPSLAVCCQCDRSVAVQDAFPVAAYPCFPVGLYRRAYQGLRYSFLLAPPPPRHQAGKSYELTPVVGCGGGGASGTHRNFPEGLSPWSQADPSIPSHVPSAFRNSVSEATASASAGTPLPQGHQAC